METSNHVPFEGRIQFGQLMEKANRFESMSVGRQVVVFFALIMAVAVILSLLAEAAVRVRSWYKHGEWALRIEEYYRFDAATNMRLPKPGHRTRRLTINSLGFRGPEIPREKPDGTTRVAFLGGSTTFCAEVSGDEKTWPFLAMQELAAAYPERRFDYLNAGVSGFSVSQSLKRFRAEVATLRPDIVVVYHVTNDLSFNSRKAAEALGFSAPRGDQDLPWLADWSMFAYLVVKNLRVQSRQREAADPAQKYPIDPEAIAQPFAADLTALVAEIRAVGAKPVLATFSARLRADQTPEEKIAASVTSLYYMPYMTPDSLVAGFAAYNDVIRATKQVTIADVAASISGDAEHFVDSVHFTDRGALAMASAIAPTLIEAAR